MSTFQNRQLGAGEKIKDSYNKLNLNNDEVEVDINALEAQLIEILNETDLDPNKDPEVTNSRNSGPWDETFPTVKERLDFSEGKITGRNYFINPNSNIWQRGEDFNPLAEGAYGPDRFYVNYAFAGVNLRVQKETTDLPPNNLSKAAIKLTYDGTTPDGIFRTKIKMSDLGLPLNELLTWSFWAKAPNGVQFFFSASDGQTKTFTGTGDWAQYFQTFVVNIDEFFIDVVRPNIFTPFAGQEVLVTQMKLEIGDKITAFEPDSIGKELRDCQRYYWQGKLIGNSAGNMYGSGGDTFMDAGSVLFPVPMRITPSIAILTNPTYDNCVFRDFLVVDNTTLFLRVDINVTGKYRAAGGIYEADAEL